MFHVKQLRESHQAAASAAPQLLAVVARARAQVRRVDVKAILQLRLIKATIRVRIVVINLSVIHEAGAGPSDRPTHRPTTISPPPLAQAPREEAVPRREDPGEHEARGEHQDDRGARGHV